MTKDKILSITGRDLDIAVAVHVMNYEKMQTIFYDELDKTKTYYCVVGSPESEEVNAVEYQDGIWLQYVFNPSIDISVAWDVVEKMRQNDMPMVLEMNNNGYRRRYNCGFHKDDVTIVDADAETAPLAICRAALLAVMEQ